jgi:asparagine synthase (glutamine-hydrolysing)
VQYVLSLPPSPWCIDKKLLRMAMRDRLPESARLRPKAPLACDPVMELLHRDGAHRVDAFEAVPALGKYVDRSAVSSVAGMRDPEQVWTELRPFCLNLWLRRLTDPGQAAQPEECYEAS